MRIEVDWDRCEANAVCVGLVPEAFHVDDDDNLHVLVEEVPPELVGRVEQAVRGCPKAALTLVRP
jgi:ferredoxin